METRINKGCESVTMAMPADQKLISAAGMFKPMFTSDAVWPAMMSSEAYDRYAKRVKEEYGNEDK